MQAAATGAYRLLVIELTVLFAYCLRRQLLQGWMRASLAAGRCPCLYESTVPTFLCALWICRVAWFLGVILLWVSMCCRSCAVEVSHVATVFRVHLPCQGTATEIKPARPLGRVEECYVGTSVMG
jgi:hypothetical protein